MNRRQFVVASSAGTILAISGCLSDDPAGENSDMNGRETDNESENEPPDIDISDDTSIDEFEVSKFTPDLSEGDWQDLYEGVSLRITSETGGELVVEMAKEGWGSPSDDDLEMLKEFIEETDFPTSVLVYALMIGSDHGYRLDPVTVDQTDDELEVIVRRWRTEGMEPQEPIPIAMLGRVSFDDEPLREVSVAFQDPEGDVVEEVETTNIEEWERTEFSHSD